MMIIGSVALVLGICVYLLKRIYQQCLLAQREDKVLSAIAQVRDVPDIKKIAHNDAWK